MALLVHGFSNTTKVQTNIMSKSDNNNTKITSVITVVALLMSLNKSNIFCCLLFVEIEQVNAYLHKLDV